jgi:predicted PurR-regulated permease PerM
MNLRNLRNPASPLTTMAAAAGIIAALYIGRDVLIPLALAVLISFLLAPLVTRLERAGMRRLLAVCAVSILAASPLPLVGWIAGLEFLELADEMPAYQSRLEEKLRAVKGPVGNLISRAERTIKELGATPEAAAPEDGQPDPVEVTLVSPSISPVQIVGAILPPLARILATAGIVFVLVLVILIHREDLRNRFIRLVSRGHLGATTRALDELAARLSSFLRAQFAVNASYGAAIGVGLWLLGVPGATFWGVACTGLRYIPYLGPIIGAVLPITLSLVVSDGWSLPLKTAGFIIALELILNNIVEPWFYGARTGVSVLAVLLAAIFWTWLWGIAGLFLSMPLTVCLVVAGRYVPQFGFLQVLLGDQPVLPPSARIYQRLLAMDGDEALEVAESALKGQTLAEFYDGVLIEVLELARRDLVQGTIDAHRAELALGALGDLADEVASAAPARSAPPLSTSRRPGVRVLCIPARDDLDGIAGRLLGNLLEADGLAARALSVQDLGSDLAAVIEEFRPDAIVISAAPPHSLTRALLRLRQVLRKAHDARVFVGVWSRPSQSDSAAPDGPVLGGPAEEPAGAAFPGAARLTAAGAAGLFTSLADAARALGTQSFRPPAMSSGDGASHSSAGQAAVS